MACTGTKPFKMSLDIRSRTFDIKFGLHWKTETVVGEMTMEDLRVLVGEMVDEWVSITSNKNWLVVNYNQVFKSPRSRF